MTSRPDDHDRPDGSVPRERDEVSHDVPDEQVERAEEQLPEAAKGTAMPSFADDSGAPDESGSAGGDELGQGAD